MFSNAVCQHISTAWERFCSRFDCSILCHPLKEASFPSRLTSTSKETFLLSLNWLINYLISGDYKNNRHPTLWHSLRLTSLILSKHHSLLLYLYSEAKKICIIQLKWKTHRVKLASFNFIARYSVTFQLHHIHHNTSSAVSLLLICLTWDILSSTSASAATQWFYRPCIVSTPCTYYTCLFWNNTTQILHRVSTWMDWHQGAVILILLIQRPRPRPCLHNSRRAESMTAPSHAFLLWAWGQPAASTSYKKTLYISPKNATKTQGCAHGVPLLFPWAAVTSSDVCLYLVLRANLGQDVC